MLAQLQAKHINTSLCLYRPSPTPSSYIIQNEQQGSRTIISHTSVQDISCNEFIQIPFSWVHFEGRNIDQGDVVFFSKLVAQHKGFTSAEDFLQFIHQQCKPNAILFCSWGDQGAACRDATGTLHIQTVPLPVTVVDTVGAGDTFIAAAIHGLSQGQSASSALTLACRTATWKVVQAGFDGLVKDVGE
ncbi:Ribokinase-like protein [Spinellus fusiger]|nr:Ribokinase-like protein [Spinellus fusiger]